jgi:hypothetical protein
VIDFDVNVHLRRRSVGARRKVPGPPPGVVRLAVLVGVVAVLSFAHFVLGIAPTVLLEVLE